MFDDKSPEKSPIPLEMDAQVARGSYCNVAIVSCNDWECVIDFAFVGPNQPKGLVVSRIILNLAQAEALHHALGEHVGPGTPHHVARR